MDDLLPMTMYDFTVCCFMVVGGTLIVFAVNPWVILRSALPQHGRLRATARVPHAMIVCHGSFRTQRVWLWSLLLLLVLLMMLSMLSYDGVFHFTSCPESGPAVERRVQHETCGKHAR